nr:tetratricopeptide repeat protein [uncultured Roseibium sp.]
MTTAPRFKQAVAYFVTIFGLMFLVGCSSSEERAENHYKRGLELVEEGDLTSASLEFRNALKLNADHTDALFAFGEVQEAEGEVQGAYRLFLGVSEQDSEHLPSRLKLVYILLTANQTEQAEKYLTEAMKIAPNDPGVLVARATFELRAGNREEAEKLAEEALKAQPGSTDALIVMASARMIANDPEGALKVLNTAPADSLNDVSLQVLKLSVLEALGDEEAIEDLFASLVEALPENNQFSQAWVRWHLVNNRPEDAERVMRQFAANRRSEDQAQLALVTFLGTQKGLDAARSELEKIIAERDKAGGNTFPLEIALGELMFRSRQGAEAIGVMQSVISETDDTEQKNQARILLAMMYGQEGDIAQSGELVNEVLDSDAKNVEALRLRASIKTSQNDINGAIDDILLALNEAPENARLRTMLGAAYERDGASVLAEEQYSKALALDNNSPEAGLPLVQFLMRHGRSDQAERVLETIRERHPGNTRVLSILAQQKLAKRDWAGAQEIAEVMRQAPNVEDGAADKIYAAALGGQDRHEESITLLQDSMTGTEGETEFLPDLIGAFVKAGRHEAAKEHLEAVLEDEPNNTLARTLLGSVYLAQSRLDEAESAYKLASTDPESALGNTSLAKFYMATNQPENAEAEIRAGLAKEETNAGLQLMLTTILQQAERFDEAIAQYEAMFAADPDSTIVANDLASLLSERKGDQASLDRAFEIAQRFRTSEVPQYLDTLGWIYYLRGEYSSALPLLRNASQNLPTMGLAHFHYGMALAQLNQEKQAIAALEKALDLKTVMTEQDLEQARQTIERLENQSATPESD